MVYVTSSVTETKNPETRVKTVNQYTLGAEVGRGTYCKVKWATDEAGKHVAVKAFSKTVLERQFVSHFDQHGASTVPLGSRIAKERHILEHINHPYICTLLEVMDDPDVETMYFVLEAMPGGQLMYWNPDSCVYHVRSDESAVQQGWGDSVQTGGGGGTKEQTETYQEPVARHLLRQLLQAVGYLHESGVIHKDLKPDNLLLTLPVPTADPRFVRRLELTSWPNVSLACGAMEEEEEAEEAAVSESQPSSKPSGQGGAAEDLRELLSRAGFALKVSDFNTAAECPQPDCRIYDAEGTSFFTPPECFLGPSDGILGKPRDLWSVGCVLFTMLFGRTPYWAEANLTLQLMILQEPPFLLPSGMISKQAEELIRQLTAREPSRRMTAAQAVEHAWFT